MKAIENFGITRYRTEEVFGLHKRVEAETALLTLESDAAMVAAYKAAVDAFDEALKLNEKNPMAAAAIEADEAADAAWSGTNMQIKAMLNHPDGTRRAVAKEAADIFAKYGNIMEMAYNEEYGRMHNLLQDLDQMGSEKLKKIFIDEWVAELHRCYDAFRAADAARTAAEAGREVGIVKEKRILADEAFRTLCTKVNALALVNGEEPYAEFIDRINVIIAQAKAVLASRQTRAKNKKTEETGATDKTETTETTETTDKAG